MAEPTVASPLADLAESILAGGAVPESVTLSWDVWHASLMVLWPKVDEHGREQGRELRIVREGVLIASVPVHAGHGLAQGTVDVEWTREDEKRG